ncbi:MAG TPA: molybdopterin-binding protein [Candidatus Eremiobacteraceae bacterium]|nr:molybdopterin-binding protein [Candidatus Eremiobacteraceae bacterium]
MKTPLLPATTYADALERWQAALDSAGTPQRLPSERIALRDAAGRMPTCIVRTRLAAPSHAVAAMDGYAVSSPRLASASVATPVTLQLETEALAVDTGSALPPGCDAVVPFERVERLAGRVRFHSPVTKGKHIRLAGEDVPPGVVVGFPGRALRPLDCAALLACGDATVEVVRRARVTLIPTGDELLVPGSQAVPGGSFESNSTMVGSAASLLGSVVTVTPAVRDDPGSIAAALRAAVATSDVVLLLGGSSRGGRDQSSKVLENLGRIVVRGVATRPAKPVNLALVGAVPVINLPGYPVASLVAFELYVAPLLRRLAGSNERTSAHATLSEPLAVAGDADEWHEVNLEISSVPVADILPQDRATSGFYSLLQSDALAHVPRGQPEHPAGSSLAINFLRHPSDLREALFAGPYDPLLEELSAMLGFRCRWSETNRLTIARDGLAGITLPDREQIKRATSERPRLEFRLLGSRLEGLAVRPQRWSANGPAPSLAASWPTAWAGAASVAAGLAAAAPASAYVARHFGLELIEPRSIWYVMLWRSHPARGEPWRLRITAALRSLRANEAQLGWQHIEVDER